MKYRLANHLLNEDKIQTMINVVKSGQLVQGQYCEKFEEEIANYLNVTKENVALVSSGTAGLHLSLMALDIKPGDGILVPTFTFPATVNVVEVMGSRPIFVDVDLETYNISLPNIQKAWNSVEDKRAIKGLIVVHEFGNPCDMKEIMSFCRENNIKVIEDAACAFGSKINNEHVGFFSDVGVFSLHPRKALTTGEGGVVVSKNKDLIKHCRILRNHGIEKKQGKIDFIMPGLNYRMTDFQAALGLSQINEFDSWIEKRRVLQQIYRDNIVSEKVKHPQDSEGHSWQSYMIRLSSSLSRDLVISKLRERGIESNYGAYNLSEITFYENKYFKKFDHSKLNSYKLFHHGLCLPLHQHLSTDDLNVISQEINQILKTFS